VLSEVVSQVYAAAAGRVPWDRPIKDVAEEFELRAVQVIGVDKKAGSLLFDLHTPPQFPGMWIDYLRHYHSVNPRLPYAASLREGEWMHDRELFDDRYVETSPFFKDFFCPYGGRYLSGTKLLENDELVVLFGAMRGPEQGALDGSDMTRMVELRHHMSEAFHNLMHYRSLQEEYIPARRILDSIPYPIVVIDDTLGVSLRNAAARNFLARRQDVYEAGGSLVFRDPDAAPQLLAALEEVRTTVVMDPLERKVVKVPRASGLPLLLFVSAVRPEVAMQAMGPALRWMVVLHDPQEPLPVIDPFLVGECFGLSPAESRVAVALARGYTIKEIAQRHRTSVNTVRTQVKNVLDKTRSDRQVELVRLVAGIPTFG
jgi:DNA-binding CsgD family transcriptional regulator